MRKHARTDKTVDPPQKYDRFLTYEYATSADGMEVLAFYQRALQRLGWKPTSSQGPSLLTGHLGDFYLDVTILGPELPDLQPEAKQTPVASPPAGTTIFFAVRVGQ